MKPWALAWCSCLAWLLQVGDSKRFLPSYVHRGLVVDRRGFLSLERPSPCLVLRSASHEDLWRLVEAVARRENSSPLALLQHMTRELRAHQAAQETEMNLQTLALDEILDSVLSLQGQGETDGFPPPPSLYSSGHPSPPVDPQQPPPNQPKHHLKYRPSSSTGDSRQELPFPVPETLLTSSGKMLNPPPGARVEVKVALPSRSGVPVPNFPEAVVTVSPLMSVVEVLRQADLTFQGYLQGTSPDAEEAIVFGRSRSRHCFVVVSVGKLRNKQDAHWSIDVRDKDGRALYESVCLPEGRQVIVTPGMRLTLTYSDT